MFGSTTIHSITFAMFQNGSQAIPAEAKLKVRLELSKEMKRGLASFQVDEKALFVDFSNIMSHGRSSLGGTFTHNISILKNAGKKITDLMVWCNKMNSSEWRPVEINGLHLLTLEKNVIQF